MALQNGILARLPKLTNIKNLCSTVRRRGIPLMDFRRVFGNFADGHGFPSLQNEQIQLPF